LIIRTNADGAEDFKIVWAPLATPVRAYWRDLIPHRPGVYILSFIVLEDWLILLEREDGLPRILVRRLASGEEHVIAFAEGARHQRRLRVRDQSSALHLFVNDDAGRSLGL
jgi:oligopeptidase B